MGTIAFVGTGLMGTGFVQALRARGETVRVWNRTIERARPLAQDGAMVCGHLEDAVRGAERVHLSLSDDASVEGVLGAVLDALAPNALLIDHTTTAPFPTAARAATLAKRGVAFLHAPVFMAPQQARTGGGIMLCAGPEPTFRRAEAALKPMTGTLLYLGERADKAAAFKLFGNAMIVALVAGLADVFAMARAVGISPKEAHELFSHFNLGGVLTGRGARMAQGDFTASFELVMARKDVRLMIETAAHGDLPLAVLPAIADRFDAAIAEGHGQQDMGVIAARAVTG